MNKHTLLGGAMGWEHGLPLFTYSIIVACNRAKRNATLVLLSFKLLMCRDFIIVKLRSERNQDNPKTRRYASYNLRSFALASPV